MPKMPLPTCHILLAALAELQSLLKSRLPFHDLDQADVANSAVIDANQATNGSHVNNPNVLAALMGVIDPEIGINIVDLGLVYRAEYGPQGIQVALTLSTPSCPLSEMVVEEVREVLQANFAEAAAIQVELVWDPPWTPDRMSEVARQLLG